MKQIGICGGAQSLPCVRGGGKNLLIFARGVVNPPVSFADSPLYTRGPLGAPNSNLFVCRGKSMSDSDSSINRRRYCPPPGDDSPARWGRRRWRSRRHRRSSDSAPEFTDPYPVSYGWSGQCGGRRPPPDGCRRIPPGWACPAPAGHGSSC